jgi:RNA-directed DNA polymerase
VRQICASAFSEQVLHHALMNICHDVFEKKQIFDSYASRKDKGTYSAIARAKCYTLENDYYLKLDIKKFFETIHHDVLKQQLRILFKEQRLLAIFDQIIDSYEAHPDRGVPIGNLTSQYFANHYLAGLDHFIKEQLRIKSYVRYMDDMILWHEDKKELQKALQEIEDFVENKLCCHLKPIQLNRTKTGLPFLGYHIFPYYMHLLQKSKTRFIRKAKRIETNFNAQIWNETACQRKILPLLAFISHAECKTFKKNVFLSLNEMEK